MIPSSRLSTRVLVALVSLAAFAATVRTSGVVDPALSPLPTRIKVVKNWAMLPDGRTWGSTGVDIGPDGHVWACDRWGKFVRRLECGAHPEIRQSVGQGARELRCRHVCVPTWAPR